MQRTSIIYAVVGGAQLPEGKFYNCQIVHFPAQQTPDCHFKGSLENCLEWAQLKCYSYHFETTRNLPKIS